MIRARIRKSFPGTRDSAAFRLDVELEIPPGITVLFGPSGSGKTLTLDCIAGFVQPDEGRILLDDALLFDAPTGVHLPPRARNCGYVFQNYALFPHMTLRENLAFAAARYGRLERRRRVNELLERFRLDGTAGRRPHEVSGGEKQRCSIARALISRPAALLLDEPARGLDAPLLQDLYSVLRQVRDDFEIPVLLVTHDLKEAFALAGEMVILRQGEVVQKGKPRAILARPANVDVARLLGTFSVLAAEVRALDPGRNTSRVQIAGQEVSGPYFPGHLIGDRVWLCLDPRSLHARERDTKPGPNELAARLSTATDTPSGVHLEFDNGLAVEMDREHYEAQRNAKEWLIHIPSGALRAL